MSSKAVADFIATLDATTAEELHGMALMYKAHREKSPAPLHMCEAQRLGNHIVELASCREIYVVVWWSLVEVAVRWRDCRDWYHAHSVFSAACRGAES